MSAEILMYNPTIHVLGYTKADFEWSENGAIKGVFNFYGLPALDYLTPQDSKYMSWTKVMKITKLINLKYEEEPDFMLS